VQDRVAGADELGQIETLIDTWAAAQLAENDTVLAVERGEAGHYRWYVRLAGEERATFTIWFTLRQRSLFFETQLLPAPEENHAALYEFLLRRNATLHGLTFSIGPEDGIFLGGHVPVAAVDAAELDRITGSTYAYVERFFRPAMRIGFSSRFGEPSP
jgi:hypothetical protein